MVRETLKEIRTRLAGQYVDIEAYKPLGIGEHYPNHFHTDNCRWTEDYNDDTEMGLYDLMDEDEYNATICANSCKLADFKEWYGERNVKVLVCMLADG